MKNFFKKIMFLLNILCLNFNFLFEKEIFASDRLPEESILKPCPDIPEEVIVGLRNALKNDFYLFTYQVNTRPILDYPIFYFAFYNREWATREWDPYAAFFFNYTHKIHFAPNRPRINGYLNFNQGFLKALESFGIGPDINTLFTLFSQLRLEERRAGFMLGGYYGIDKWHIDAKIPVEYQIRNFFLPNSEKRLVPNIIFDDNDPSTNDEKEEDRFTRQHLISDKIGFGDTRVNIGFRTLEKPTATLVAGLHSTLPTAFSLQRGLYGNKFPIQNSNPGPVLQQLLNLIFVDLNVEQAQKEGIEFLIKSIDTLSSNLLQPGLGNGRHLGLGAFFDFELIITEKLSMRNWGAVEYLMRGKEQRFFLRQKDTAAFDRLNVDPDSKTCSETLDFLNQALIDTFFPRVYSTWIHPGVTLKVTNAFEGRLGDYWTIRIGLDTWYRQREHIGTIKAPEEDLPILRKNIAQRPSGYQSKIFGSALFARSSHFGDWSLSAYFDHTFISASMGKDLMIGISFEAML